MIWVSLLAGLAFGQIEKFIWEVEDGSDVDETGEIITRANWASYCDPWKINRAPNGTEWKTMSINGEWTCPEDLRSPSGCGDFVDDPRADTCDEVKEVTTCPDSRWVHGTQPWIPQVHACVQHPIKYTTLNTIPNSVSPPFAGRHRERWPKWGEYEYMPPQRYLHAMEHGGVIIMYHPCLAEETICKIRQYIHDINNGRLGPMDSRFPGSKQSGEAPKGGGMGNTGKFESFRFLMTPFKNLRTPFAMVAGTSVWFSKCWNPDGMDDFLMARYRRAWEDVSGDGTYNYLWRDYTSVDKCTLVENKFEMEESMESEDPEAMKGDKPNETQDTTALIILTIVMIVLNVILLAIGAYCFCCKSEGSKASAGAVELN